MKKPVRNKLILTLVLLIVTGVFSVLAWTKKDAFFSLFDPTYRLSEPFDLQLPDGPIEMMIDTEEPLKVQLSGKGSGSARIRYSSENKDIVKVDRKGNLQAVGLGYCQITVRSRRIEKTVDVIVEARPKSLELDRYELFLPVGSDYQLEYQVYPVDAYSAVRYDSSNEKTAIIDENGVISALKEGDCLITVTTANGLQESLVVHVESLAADISFSKDDVIILKGRSYRQNLKITNPEEAGKVTYTSSDSSVATVDSEGNVKALQTGRTLISVQTENGLRTSYRVEVKISDVQVAVRAVPMMPGKTFHTRTTFQSIDPDARVLYRSSDPQIAEVDENGLIRAKGYGECTVTAYSSDGFDSVDISVLVRDDIVANGIDVSSWQGNISAENWQKIRDEGIDFAYIRIAYSSVDNGFMDNYFIRNYQRAKAAGLDVGAYHYVTCTDLQQAREEADSLLYFLSSGDYRFEYPLMMDFEDRPQAALPPQEQNALIDCYCSILKQAGYEVIVYSYANNLRKLDESVLGKYGVAVAHWGTLNPNQRYKGPFTVWQYTSDGYLPPIRGRVDMDLSFFDYPSYIRQNHLNGY